MYLSRLGGRKYSAIISQHEHNSPKGGNERKDVCTVADCRLAFFLVDGRNATCLEGPTADIWWQFTVAARHSSHSQSGEPACGKATEARRANLILPHITQSPLLPRDNKSQWLRLTQVFGRDTRPTRRHCSKEQEGSLFKHC